MSKKDFDDFLSKKSKSPVPEVDWKAEKDEWLCYLNGLYKLFEKSLEEYVEKKKITIKYDEIEITEEHVGVYIAKKMILAFGDERITLKPIGTFLIGAKGRVDMSGKTGSVKIVLVDSHMQKLQDHIKISVFIDAKKSPIEDLKIQPEEIDWQWKFITAPPTHAYQPVNQDTIYSTMMELSND